MDGWMLPVYKFTFLAWFSLPWREIRRENSSRCSTIDSVPSQHWGILRRLIVPSATSYGQLHHTPSNARHDAPNKPTKCARSQNHLKLNSCSLQIEIVSYKHKPHKERWTTLIAIVIKGQHLEQISAPLKMNFLTTDNKHIKKSHEQQNRTSS